MHFEQKNAVDYVKIHIDAYLYFPKVKYSSLIILITKFSLPVIDYGLAAVIR